MSRAAFEEHLDVLDRYLVAARTIASPVEALGYIDLAMRRLSDARIQAVVMASEASNGEVLHGNRTDTKRTES